MPQHLYFALDLHDDLALIAEYERWHQPDKIWPEIVASMTRPGIIDVEVFRTGNRLLLVMHTTEDFSAADKAASDAANPRVQDWETLMWTFQKALPCAKSGEKWVPMHRIFSLGEAREATAGSRQPPRPDPATQP
jgi:L-rhamnose mutarotase